jgi:hypothetical protein
MLDLIGGGLLGSIFGGLFRLFPEVIKFFDKKNERDHELLMFKEQTALERTRGDIKLQEIGAHREAANDIGSLEAFTAAINQQTEMVNAAGNGWVAALSASVRPIVTYIILGIWAFIHLYTAFTTGIGIEAVFKLVMTPDFTALVSGTLNYWFLDRTLSKRGL